MSFSPRVGTAESLGGACTQKEMYNVVDAANTASFILLVWG